MEKMQTFYWRLLELTYLWKHYSVALFVREFFTRKFSTSLAVSLGLRKWMENNKTAWGIAGWSARPTHPLSNILPETRVWQKLVPASVKWKAALDLQSTLKTVKSTNIGIYILDWICFMIFLRLWNRTVGPDKTDFAFSHPFTTGDTAVYVIASQKPKITKSKITSFRFVCWTLGDIRV